jgi:hypothetical protein
MLQHLFKVVTSSRKYVLLYMFLTAIGLTPGCSSTVHILHKLYTEYRGWKASSSNGHVERDSSAVGK